MKFIKIWGLQHTATNYLEQILNRNFKDILVLVNQLGWKHGPIVRNIDWSGKNWVQNNPPDVNEMLQIKNDLESIKCYKNEIIQKFNNNEIYNIVVIKDVYDWYNGVKIKRIGSNYNSTKDVINVWNNMCNDYFDYYKVHKSNTIIFSYYKLRNNLHDCMKELIEKFEIKLYDKENFYNLNVHIGNDGKPVNGIPTKIYDYKNKTNNFIDDVAIINNITKFVNRKTYLKYLKISRIKK